MQEKHSTPNHPHIWDKKSEQGNRGYIGYRFPLSLSTIWRNHLPLTSKWRGTFQYFQFFFNVENSIKREMKWLRKNFFLHQFCIFFNVANSIKREENMKYWKQILKMLCFSIFKKIIKNSNNIPSISKTTQHIPMTWCTYLQSFEKILWHQCVFELQCENWTWWTDRRTDRQTDGGGVAISPVPRPTARREIKTDVPYKLAN